MTSPPLPPAAAAPSAGGVAAVARALALLDAFGIADTSLPLAELARRTGLAKPTVLRLARTLAASGYLVGREGGAWRLGPAVARLGARYQRAFDLRNVIEPALQTLAEQTGHSASFFTQEDGQRVRLLRVRGADGFVSPGRVGEPLPLDRGAAGQVFLAYAGAAGQAAQTIRKRGYHLTIGEADATAASIAAPVFAARGGVLGAVSIAVPADAGAAAELSRHAQPLVETAQRLSQTLAAARYASDDHPALRSHWHP
ncbi:IclR family transcriptional regulator [Xylophilus sp.]|uniref:IclR family transcriptional regulator n=1 Tax=Xylophilus sp. TaxID=2653893 RepID=UPI0013BD284F|nr:helix-turn-helix domain-containing protein [Xylophilus sp.]KAF1041805.1 MAG: Transcriptional repressor IclR [Xylophilus sp.]